MDETRRVLTLVKQGKFFVSDHALMRMRTRNISVADIRHCAETGTITLQAHHNFLIKGNDIEDVAMNVVCDYIDGVIIVSAFYEEGSE